MDYVKKLFQSAKRIFVYQSRLKLIQKRQVITLLGIILVAALFEGFSIALLLPILDFIEKSGDLSALTASGNFWKYIINVHDYFSMPVTLVSLMTITATLVLLKQFFEYLKRVYTTHISEMALFKMRSSGFRTFLETDLSFYSKENTGSMLNTLMMEGTRAAFSVMSVLQIVGYFFIVLAYFAILLFINAQMTLYASLFTLILGISLSRLVRKIKSFGSRITELNNRLSKTIIECLGAVRLIKLSGTENRECKAQSQLAKGLYSQQLSISKINGLVDSAMHITVLFAALAIIYTSTQIYSLSLAQVSIFLFILLRLLPIAQHFIAYLQNILSSSASLKFIKEILDKANHHQQIQSGSKEFTGLNNKIEFKDVTFRYEDQSSLVLDKLSLTISAKKMTAIVGRSGAGKSTLANLLPRLIQQTQGSVSFDGIPSSDFSLRSLRSRIRFVSQESYLFDTTIYENIRYGESETSLEEVQNAAKKAYIHDFIMGLPDQYQTRVSERGVNLSGGQKQRIALARALLKNASIIVLDEPTSALDSESETYIQKAIENLRDEHQRTLIIIAHRLSTVRNADQILVLDQGKLVESGGHDELVHSDDWYSSMFRLQSVTIADAS